MVNAVSSASPSAGSRPRRGDARPRDPAGPSRAELNPAMRYCIPCRRLVRLEQWVDHSPYHQIRRRIFGPLRLRREARERGWRRPLQGRGGRGTRHAAEGGCPRCNLIRPRLISSASVDDDRFPHEARERRVLGCAGPTTRRTSQTGSGRAPDGAEVILCAPALATWAVGFAEGSKDLGALCPRISCVSWRQSTLWVVTPSRCHRTGR